MDLIKITAGIIGKETVQTVNARDLHAFLGVSTAFKDWVARRISEYGFFEGQDFCSFLSESRGGRPAKEYALTLDMAKELAMVERNEKGKQARAYFIECERRLRVAPAPLPQRGLTEEDKKLLFGTVTTIVRREFAQAVTKVENTLTAQNRHLWKAITGGKNALSLQNAGFVEVGAVYRLAGLSPSGLPSQGKLSGNISRALDAYCKRHSCLTKSAQVGSREVTYWPENAVVAWLAEKGHEMIRAHLANSNTGKVTPLRSVQP